VNRPVSDVCLGNGSRAFLRVRRFSLTVASEVMGLPLGGQLSQRCLKTWFSHLLGI
jgi:hypothetical protein